jgi:hypothetical protein
VNKDKKPLSETHPELAKEADGWDPKTVVAGMHKKLNWKCSKGHKWVTEVRLRSLGTGCPICNNKQLLVGYNDMATTNPELAKEAYDWDPKTVITQISKKLKWKCARGHIWPATINHRTKGSGCPYCANSKVLTGFNDLATTHPDLAKEADGWDPKTVIAGTHKKLNWKCLNKHKWNASVQSRSRGTGCPYCVNKRVLLGFNDLATTHPEIAKEADGWDPKTVIAGTGKKLNWKCSFGHRWVSPGSMRIQAKGCPTCGNRKLEMGFNDLATTHPELAKEADGWDPKTVHTGSHLRLDWICSDKHKWKAVLYSRISGTGCPVCKNKKVLSGFNDLATTHPEIAKEADGWDPKTVTGGSSSKRKWVCSYGHTWQTAISHRTAKKGCPFCANQKVLVGFNDLATTHPELAKEADGWDPRTVIAGTDKKLNWKCSIGHKFTSACNGRTSKNRGCPICTNQRVLIGFNDLATTHPELAKEADGWDPKTVVAGTNVKNQWRCNLNHNWNASVSNRVHGAGCPYCSNHKVLRGFNDLATTHPELAKEADGWDPKTVISSTRVKLKWKCDKGHKWVTNGDNRVRGNNCPSCAKFGFDPNEQAFVYFLINPIWEIYQIGITNVPKVRLNKHKRIGFELLDLRGPMDGFAAKEIETSILKYLEQNGAKLSPEHVAGKFDGYSESWTMDSYKVNNLKELIDKANEAGF